MKNMRKVVNNSSIAVALTAMSILLGCGKSPVPPEDSVAGQGAEAVAEVIDHPLPQLREGYAGAETCVECHDYEHETWHDSYHRTMTTLVSPETVQGNFSNQFVSVYGSSCILEEKDGEYWIEMQSKTEVVRRQLKMITGSHHMQAYWFPTGNMRVTGMAPVVWINEEQTWIPRDAAFLKPPKKTRSLELFRWSVVCIRCHTTGGNPAMSWEGGSREAGDAPDVMETHASEFGISCEACHGKAAEHVALRREKGHIEIENDPILVPTDLDPALSSQTCGQCHAIRLMEDESARVRFLEDGLNFCVGQNLDESGQYVWDLDDGPDHPVVQQALEEDPQMIKGYFWPDGMVRVSGREYNGLIKSPCFTHDDNSRKMSCFDCHQMHQDKKDTRSRKEWADDQLKVGERNGASCIRCHEGFDTMAHTHHAAGSAGSNCLNCHMPYTTYGLLKAIRSHTISSPSVQESVHYGRPNACNQCHLDKTFAWTAEHLQSKWGVEPPKLKARQETVPASLIWLYAGDASQRALAAWSLGWEHARAASGESWLARPLIDRLNDEYDAVRFIAFRSLRRDPRYKDFEYDFMGLSNQNVKRMRVAREMDDYREAWRDRLDTSRGAVPENILERLSLTRDLSSIHLLE